MSYQIVVLSPQSNHGVALTDESANTDALRNGAGPNSSAQTGPAARNIQQYLACCRRAARLQNDRTAARARKHPPTTMSCIIYRVKNLHLVITNEYYQVSGLTESSFVNGIRWSVLFVECIGQGHPVNSLYLL